MPDIDMDFADDRRDEVIEYVVERYGRERVAQIITFGRLLARAAIRDVGRALDYPLTRSTGSPSWSRPSRSASRSSRQSSRTRS